MHIHQCIIYIHSGAPRTRSEFLEQHQYDNTGLAGETIENYEELSKFAEKKLPSSSKVREATKEVCTKEISVDYLTT